ncbi:ROK family protein [Devosia sp. Root685]|uniref:ROK family protein n=1 Tax=Devosia sp. Root685 TaxID=1736587 RepID=UPI00138EE4A4|nr:ROK family protein [Devosia sp. Root685]
MTDELQQRPALAQKIGLSRMAVSELLAGLETRGLVQVAGAIGGAPGRSQLSYTIKADAAMTVGFDVGGTKVAGALSDLRGHILAELTEPTVLTGAENLVAQLGRMTATLCDMAGAPRFRLRVGAVGVPAAVHPETADLSLAGNVPGLEGANLRGALAAAMGVDVLIDNDVNLALLAEVGQGSARGRQNVAFVALGTGIGAALMINGRLLRGAHGGAGEIGYMPLWRIDAPGVPSLEEQVGEAGIRRAYVAAGGDAAHTVRDIFAAAEAGDGAAAVALDAAGETVSRAILALLALVDPDMIVLGGSIGARPEFIARVENKVSGTWERRVGLVRSQSGGRAGLLGALELARRHMLDEMFGALP